MSGCVPVCLGSICITPGVIPMTTHLFHFPVAGAQERRSVFVCCGSRVDCTVIGSNGSLNVEVNWLANFNSNLLMLSLSYINN